MNKRKKKTLANIVIVAIIICGIAWIASTFVHLGGEYTNNAQVEQDIVKVTARVQGFVERIYVAEYQHVNKGDTLLTIEDSEFQLHLKQAIVALETARTGKRATEKGAEGAQNQTGVSEAAIAEVEVLLRNAEADYQRFRNLYEQEAVTKQQFEAVETQYLALKAKEETMRRQRAGTSINHQESGIRVQQQATAIEAAEAAVRLAELNLSYCTVLAPCSGQTARRMVQEGELASPGRQLFSIVSDPGKWVVANFRETQMQHIHVGSRVRMKIDAIGDSILMGKVVTISGATGARYSPVAPDNATGNFVKVEQRIPVKIEFCNSGQSPWLKRLSAGMNVECTVEK